MTSQTPIFDQLVDEFNKSGVYEFGFVYQPETRTTPSDDGISFLANLGEALAQEESEEEWTDEDRIIQTKTGLVQKPHLIPRDSSYYPGDRWMKQHGITPLGGWPEGESTAEMDVVAEFKEDEPAAIRYGVVYSDSILRRNILTPEQQREGNGVTSKTLYDATNLAVIKPAIPEMVKMPHGPSEVPPEPDEDATVVLDNKVLDDLTEQRKKDHGENWVGPQSATERLKEADAELGLDDFDEAFRKADEVLEPQTIVTLPKKVTPLQVAEFKRKVAETNPNVKVEQELPRRRNKRNNRNRNQSRSGATANKAA